MVRLLLLSSVFAIVGLACRDGGPTPRDAGPATTDAATLAASTSVTTPGEIPTEMPLASAAPVTFSVIGGARQGAIDVDEFLPPDVRIRVGDTIEWTSSGSVGHTVSFAGGVHLQSLTDYTVPDPADPAQLLFNPEISLRFGGETYDGAGEFVSSGFIGVFRESTYKLTFTRAGLYEYICLNHPLTMRGTVDVTDAGTPVESPASVAARGRALLSTAIDDAQAAVKHATDSAAARSKAAAAGAPAVHIVTAGIPTSSGQVMTFVQPGLEINAGDTVIFETEVADLHNVVFKGSRDAFPPAYDVYPDPAGRGLTVALNGESADVADPPAGGLDETTFLSSGTLGVVLGLRNPRFTWRLIFTQPGTYLYQCTIHVASGMAGLITVR